MTALLEAADRAAIEPLVATLEAAWNAADGDAFAARYRHSGPLRYRLTALAGT